MYKNIHPVLDIFPEKPCHFSKQHHVHPIKIKKSLPKYNNFIDACNSVTWTHLTELSGMLTPLNRKKVFSNSGFKETLAPISYLLPHDN